MRVKSLEGSSGDESLTCFRIQQAERQHDDNARQRIVRSVYSQGNFKIGHLFSIEVGHWTDKRQKYLKNIFCEKLK
jgi:hypothetical protein